MRTSPRQSRTPATRVLPSDELIPNSRRPERPRADEGPVGTSRRMSPNDYVEQPDGERPRHAGRPVQRGH